MNYEHYIEFKKSGIHGMGGFAKTHIPRGIRLIEYVGEKISKPEAMRRCEANNPFIFEIDEDWDLDGSVDWNPARFINHSCDPNCETELVGKRVWIVTLRSIEPGEELSFNYCYDLEEYQDHPCCCGSPKCLGYIVAEEFAEVLRQKKEAISA